MIMPFEKIQEKINDMGYITAVPQKTPVPSFYKLGDGTIISVLTRINDVLKDPHNPNGIFTNTSTDIHVFVEPKNRGVPSKIIQNPIPPSSIIDEDLECMTLLEEFNEYRLSNNKIMSIKTLIAQVAKTNLYNSKGDPIYQVNATALFKFRNK